MHAHYLTINRDYFTGNLTPTSFGNVSTEQTYDNYGGLASYEADYALISDVPDYIQQRFPLQDNFPL